MNAIRLFIATTLLGLSTTAVAETLEVQVNGLVCAFCAQGIERSLRQFAATDEVFVSLEHRLVAVSLKEGQMIDESELRQAITEAGYTTVAIARSDASIDMIRARVHHRPANDE